MGRAKIQIVKIPKASGRHVTYGKRSKGLLKKAYELSVLCDAAVLVVMFSPSGKLTSQCEPVTETENVLQRFVKTPPQERTKRRNEKKGEDPAMKMPAAGEWGPKEQNEYAAKQQQIDYLRSFLRTRLDHLEVSIKNQFAKVMEHRSFMDRFISSSNGVGTSSSQILPMKMPTNSSYLDQMQLLQVQRPTDLQTMISSSNGVEASSSQILPMTMPTNNSYLDLMQLLQVQRPTGLQTIVSSSNGVEATSSQILPMTMPTNNLYLDQIQLLQIQRPTDLQTVISSSNGVETSSSQILPMTVPTNNLYLDQLQLLQVQRPTEMQTQAIVRERLHFEEEHLPDVGQASRAATGKCSAWSDPESIVGEHLHLPDVGQASRATTGERSAWSDPESIVEDYLCYQEEHLPDVGQASRAATGECSAGSDPESILKFGDGENLCFEEEHLPDVGQASRAVTVERSAWSDPAAESYFSNFRDVVLNKVAPNKPVDPFERFDSLCPPGGEERVVIYVTSLRDIKKTFEDCSHMKFVVQGYKVAVDERDVSMHASFRQELKDLLGNPVPVPRLFIRGRYIGGSEEMSALHEDGTLAKLLATMPTQTSWEKCVGCGDRRFIPCSACSGFYMMITEDDEVVPCQYCDENGLIRCPICY